MESTRVALVTGGSRGLGQVIARVLGARGYALVLAARDSTALEETAGHLARIAPAVVTVAGDITEATTRARLIEAARGLGGLDVLVNNAAELGPIGPLLTFDVPRFARLFPVNVGAPLVLTQMAVPYLKPGMTTASTGSPSGVIQPYLMLPSLLFTFAARRIGQTAKRWASCSRSGRAGRSSAPGCRRCAGAASGRPARHGRPAAPVPQAAPPAAAAAGRSAPPGGLEHRAGFVPRE